MVGPNCMGDRHAGRAVAMDRHPHRALHRRPGRDAGHSGSIGEILVSLGPRVGFRTVVSAGNETITDVADMTAYFADDPECRVVGLFLETVRRPAAFEEALRRLAEAGKVAIVLKVGTSEMGARAALAHTGALVGSDRTFSAMLRYYNAIRCDDFGTWLEHLEVFSRAKPPRGAADRRRHQLGRRGRVLRRQGGAGGHPAPARSPTSCRRGSTKSSRTSTDVGNPADCWAIDDDRIVFPRVFQLMAESGEFDVLVSNIDHSNWLVGGERELAQNIADDLRAACEGTDLFPCVITVTTACPPVEDLRWAREHDIPMLKGIAARAAGAGLAAGPHGGRVPPARDVAAGGAAGGQPARWPSSTRPRSPPTTACPTCEAERCDTADEAVAAAERIGYPVVVKIDNVAHKARVGGVALNLSGRHRSARGGGADGRRRDRRRAGQRAASRCWSAWCATRTTGPTVVVGIGGALAEALDLVTASLAPLDARRRPRAGGRACPRWPGCSAATAPDGLIDAVVAVSQLAAEHPEIAEIDVNPLLVSPERAVALDCLIVLKGSESR